MPCNDQWLEFCTGLWRATVACCGNSERAATAVASNAVLSVGDYRREKAYSSAWFWRELARDLQTVAPPPQPVRVVGDMHQALAALPVPQRIAVALVDVAGLDIRRAAKATGQGEADFRLMRHAALQGLRSAGIAPMSPSGSLSR